MSRAIELVDVWKIYKLGTIEIIALRGVNLSINQGEFIAIVGPSGSGKTTLLNIIGGLEKPTKGIVKIFNRRIDNLSENELAKFRNENIGFVFQMFYLIPKLTALENVELPLIAKGLSKSERRKLAMEALEIVGLKERAKHKPTQLSGGEQQRIAIARAIVTKPKILLADEPTGNLDSETAKRIMEIFTKLNKDYGITIVLVTHNIELTKYCSRVVRIKDGVIIES